MQVMPKSKKSKSPELAVAAPNIGARKASPSKVSILIGLMTRKAGASLAEMQEATGWQAHSVRGALSGAIGKARGLSVTSRLVGVQRRYFIDKAA